MSTHERVRPSPIAGSWYSDDPNALGQQVDGFLSSAELLELDGELVGLIAPHAAYRYSGRTAGHAFACARGLTPELVAVVSPFHAFHDHPFLTSAHEAYQTPLGLLELDSSAMEQVNEELAAATARGLAPLAYDGEHSLEVELPFLQRALKGEFCLLPVMVNSVNPEECRQLGTALARVLHSRSALLVASTDLSHFHPEAEAKALDEDMLGQITAFSPEGVLQAQRAGRGYACGAGAVAAVLWAARQLGAERVKLLDYSTSGDVTGDKNSVVGYGAAAILKRA